MFYQIFFIALWSYGQCRSPFLDIAFKNSKIVNDAIDVAPKDTMKIVFPSGKRAMVGNDMNPSDIAEVPRISFKAKQDQLYTLIMIDLDVPSRENRSLSNFDHWLVVNIPGKDISKGKTLTEFIGSQPPKDSGLHRYALLAYKQPGELDVSEERLIKKDDDVTLRMKFNVREFTEKYNLGNPVAGNFYRSHPE